MSTIFVCDGCGKRTEPRFSKWSPNDWFSKKEVVGMTEMTYHACSRECIEVVAKKFNTSHLVLPV